jgi:glucose-1-phosphate adenylyltransferase
MRASPASSAILASGIIISGGSVIQSILFPNVRVEEGSTVKASLLFDNVVVGSNARLKRCIVDKNVCIPPGETIGLDRAKDTERFSISDQGIVVVPKRYRFES